MQGTISNLIDWCEGFLLDRRAQQLADGTIQFYQKKLKKFLSWCHMQEVNDIEQVTPEVIRQFIVYLSKSHNRGGVVAFIKALRAFFNWYESETDQRSPMHKIKTPSLPDAPLEPANSDDLKRMISISGKRDKAILLFILDTGIRANELIMMNVEDVNLITGIARITHGKGGKTRTVYIERKTRKALRAYVHHEGALFQTDEGERFTYSGLRMMLIRRAKEAGVKAPTLHSIRRLFAVTMLRNGVDVYSLQLLMGHADLQVLRRYLKLTEGDTFAAHVKGSPVEKLI